MAGFNLSTVFDTVATAVPDQEVLVWRDRRFTYAAMNNRMDGVAHFLVEAGLGARTERDGLAGHESGQDHLGIYLRNGNEYLEAMIGSWRARVAPYNVNYRYVTDELVYLLTDAQTVGLVYHAEFAPQVAAIRDRVPSLRVLVQVADESGHELLDGAVDYESAVGTPAPTAGMPTPDADDLFLIYTGGTTGMPKGVLWRHDDVFISAMGGLPFGTTTPYTSYYEIAQAARDANGGICLLMLPPFMHGAAQWSAFHMITTGGKIVIPDNVHRMDPADALSTAIRERCLSIPVVGDAVARPLVEELERAAESSAPYDMTGVAAVSNGGAPMSPTVRTRLRAALPHVMLLDAVGSSETGIQMNHYPAKDAEADTAIFDPQDDTTVVSEDLTRRLEPGKGGGWLARSGRIPLGYLGDEAKTARTFPVIDGVRWSVPGDRANLLADGRVQLLGRDGVTVNSGGEKIFVEEVERAMAVLRVAEVERSPSGKADYRWAKDQALASVVVG